MNEFNIGIGARKAKKLGTIITAEPVAEAVSAPEPKKMIELRNDVETIAASAAIRETREVLNSAPITPTTARATVMSSDTVVKSASDTLSKDQIIMLAQKHGLKFEGMKKEFVKHTYSVTLDSKTLFKKYCDTLGLNMQDAMDEALQDFFKKHALEYNRVKEAKRG